MIKFFTKKKKQLTIEQIESEIGDKLTYPNQRIKGSADEEKYQNLKNFGCSDIWDEKETWIHRDCWPGSIKTCKKCNFYPIVEKYNKEHNISNDTQKDFIKAGIAIDCLVDNLKDKK